jgi:hypothetical protein
VPLLGRPQFNLNHFSAELLRQVQKPDILPLFPELCCGVVFSAVGKAALTTLPAAAQELDIAHFRGISHHPSCSGHSNVIRFLTSHQHSGRVAFPASNFHGRTLLERRLTADGFACDETAPIATSSFCTSNLELLLPTMALVL